MTVRRWVAGLLVVVAACGGDGEGDAGSHAAVPTWSDSIATLVHRSCTPCHRPGETAPFALLTYEDVQRRKNKIAEVTAARLMPPWLPSGAHFVEERRLADDDLARLQRWCAAGTPRGDAAKEPPPPQFSSGWQLGAPDRILRPAVPIEVEAAAPDRVRNFVLTHAEPRERYVAAVEIRPGNPAVHHAVLAVEGSGRVRRLDAADPEPGFEAMDLGGAKPPDGRFLGWTPGKVARRAPDGHAWRLRPGEDLVLQLHLTATGKAETVRPEIGLYFTDAPPTVISYPLTMFASAIDLPPGAQGVTVRDAFVTPLPIAIHSVYPHAHYLCTTMRAWAKLPSGERRTLFEIERWDFDWQDDYRYVEPLELPAGTELAFEYVYDNSADNPANPSRPPRHVRLGDRSTDEMANLTLQVVLPDEAARRVLGEASIRADLRKLGEDAALLAQLATLLRDGGRHQEGLAAADRALAAQPTLVAALVERGVCLQRLGRAGEAEAAYREALRREPTSFDAQAQLAGLLLAGSRPAEAIAAYEAALRLRPGTAAIHANLGVAYLSANDSARAEGSFRAGLAIDRDSFAAWYYLGEILRATGRGDEAKQALREALRLRPGEPRAAAALAALGG